MACTLDSSHAELASVFSARMSYSCHIHIMIVIIRRIAAANGERRTPARLNKQSMCETCNGSYHGTLAGNVARATSSEKGTK